MSTLEVRDSKHSNRGSIPRWMALILGLFVWLVAIPLAHALVPWALSLLAPRYGWTQGNPAIWNQLGLIPVVVGAACLIWILVLGLAKTPERVELEWNSPFLLQRGPYAFTRNPMYVAELGLWLGWAIFYGSVPVLIGLVVLYVLVNYVVLPREEGALEARFGENYRHYKTTVPRWLGKSRR